MTAAREGGVRIGKTEGCDETCGKLHAMVWVGLKYSLMNTITLESLF